MFRAELSRKLSEIFGIRNVSFDAHSDSFEQDTLFIEIEHSHARATETTIHAKVMGSLVIFSQLDKLPYGFFNKKIQSASHALTKDLYFYEIDVSPPNSPARSYNLSERRTRFIYLFSTQYDPAQGALTSISIEETNL